MRPTVSAWNSKMKCKVSFGLKKFCKFLLIPTNLSAFNNFS